ncbi:MAG TPA: hypothetical protein VFQ61_03305 [Polyangiaceae bacterium]|nr:hypothetical protein [Polyangiaceae bacterium]
MTDSAMPSKIEQDHLLYEDETGEVVGLHEVSLLDPVPSERIPRVQLLLLHPDIFIVYQAVLVLTAWGDDKGLNKLEELVDRRIHNEFDFAPHRSYGYDNVYDEFAGALDIRRLVRTDDGAQVCRVYEKLLGLYGPCGFEDRLKYALLNCDCTMLVTPIDLAITRALEWHRIYLASQLLPPLARFSPQRALERVGAFSNLGPMTPNPQVNVAEALRWISPEESRPRLEKLERHPDQVVADEARASLAKLDLR